MALTEASGPAASLLKTRGPRAPLHPQSHLQPGPEPSLQAPLPRLAGRCGLDPAGWGWGQERQGGGTSMLRKEDLASLGQGQPGSLRGPAPRAVGR